MLTDSDRSLIRLCPEMLRGHPHVSHDVRVGRFVSQHLIIVRRLVADDSARILKREVADAVAMDRSPITSENPDLGWKHHAAAVRALPRAAGDQRDTHVSFPALPLEEAEDLHEENGHICHPECEPDEEPEELLHRLPRFVGRCVKDYITQWPKHHYFRTTANR